MPKDYQPRYAGYPWWDVGTTRGTTTSSAVLVVPTTFLHKVIIAHGYDQASNARNSLMDVSAGTFYSFIPLTTNPSKGYATQARFRVWKTTMSAGGTSSSTTWATATSGVTIRYEAMGY